MYFNVGMEKGFGRKRCSVLTFLSVILFLATPIVITIPLYEPCDLNDPTACKQYNSTAVICLPRTQNSPPNDPGLCNCFWNAEFPHEYDFDETRLTCVAFVGGYCINSPVDPRYCVENAFCRYNSPLGRCQCLEDFMEDYENATRKCVERKLDVYELCENEGISSKYKCKSFYNHFDMTTTTLACIPFNDFFKWCDCEGNTYEINYKFHNSKCLGLVGSPCDDDPCYETSRNSTFCNYEKKCECNAGFSANEDKICIKYDYS